MDNDDDEVSFEDKVSKPTERFSLRSSFHKNRTTVSGLKMRKSALELKI